MTPDEYLAGPGEIPARPDLSEAAEASAWESCVLEHRDFAEGIIASQVSGIHNIQEVLQETLSAALGGRMSAPSVNNVRSWLGGIARNKAKDHLRRAGRRERLVEKVKGEPQDQAGYSPSPADWLLRGERIELARDAISRLPEEDAYILKRKYLDGWGYGAIAEEAGLEKHDVTNRLRRARGRLRRILETKGINHEDNL